MNLTKSTLIGICATFLFDSSVLAQTPNTKNKTVAKSKTVIKNIKMSAAEIAEAKGVLAKSDCMVCHKVEQKVIGPAFVDVAKKYPVTEANLSLLSKKIINGGSGVWGSVAMSPHPALTQAEARKMVQYILTLN